MFNFFTCQNQPAGNENNALVLVGYGMIQALLACASGVALCKTDGRKKGVAIFLILLSASVIGYNMGRAYYQGAEDEALRNKLLMR